MKAICLFVVMLFPSISLAQPMLSGEELDLKNEKNSLELNLEQRKADFTYSVGTWQEDRITLQQKASQIQTEWGVLKQRCTGETSNETFYNACMMVQAQLRSREVALQEEGRLNNEQQKALQMIEAALLRDIARVDQITARLAEIRSYENDCERASEAYARSADPINDGTMERMRAECGSMFDGN